MTRLWQPRPVPPGPGQESVWDYPRPPRVEPCRKRAVVMFGGIVIADSIRVLRVLETSHPPVYYLPPADVRLDLLRLTAKRSYCEWKGQAQYLDVVVGGREAAAAAWCYRQPTAAFDSLRDHVAFYAQRMDGCWLGGERVRPQPGGFYGGWITDDVVGPFKGEPGSAGW